MAPQRVVVDGALARRGRWLVPARATRFTPPTGPTTPPEEAGGVDITNLNSPLVVALIIAGLIAVLVVLIKQWRDMNRK